MNNLRDLKYFILGSSFQIKKEKLIYRLANFQTHAAQYHPQIRSD